MASHEELTTFLATRTDGELTALVAAGTPNSVGVGGDSLILEVAGTPVFAKRVPLTDRERANHGSTANLFGLPVYCQYGVVSPGFNAWRELAANTITTEGVRQGATTSFPLLHHWRILPGRSPIPPEHADVDAVVAALGDHPAVRRRFEELAAARYSLVLFSEYIPHPATDWLSEARATTVERQLAGITGFLSSRRLLHMDGHFGNLRTDGERLYLTDFGLATSPRFDLSPAESEFAERHATHDAAYAAMRLVNWLVADVCGIPALVPRNEFVRRCAAGEIPDDVPPAVAAILARNAPAAAKMNAFYWKLFDGDIHAEYPPP